MLVLRRGGGGGGFRNHNTDGCRTGSSDGWQRWCGEEARSVRLPWRRRGERWEACLVGAGRSKVRVKPFKTRFAGFFSGCEESLAPAGTVDPTFNPKIPCRSGETMECPLQD